MTGCRVMRRAARDLSAERAWHFDRAWQMSREIAGGLGTRPLDWWLYDSGRPDLAESPGYDVYCHVAGDCTDAARRLTYLASSGELTASEYRAIFEGRGPRYEWRQDVLRSLGMPR